jgi:hypothetical protein
MTIETPRLPGLTRDLPREERRVQDKINRTMRLLDVAAENAFQEAAPYDTGALRKSLRSSLFFRGNVARITVRVRATRDRFNYLPVTRFGHIATVIVPRHRKQMKVYVHGRSNPPILRRSVRGYHPEKDWVDQAGRQVSLLVRSASRELAREIETTVIT